MDLQPIVATLPLALAAAFSPSGLLFVMLTMSGPRGRKGALVFDLGAIAFLVVLVAVFDMAFGFFVDRGSVNPFVSGAADVFFGILIAIITLRGIFGKKPDKKEDSSKRHLPLLVLGFVYMAINVSTLIPFIAANKTLFISDLGIAPYAICTALLILITMTLMLFPVLVKYVAPQRSEKLLGPIERFMQKHGKILANVYFFIIGVYLVVKGILQLV